MPVPWARGVLNQAAYLPSRIMETFRRKVHRYLQPSVGRDNDRRGEDSATVNVLQS
jgi:hypothetical protein